MVGGAPLKGPHHERPLAAPEADLDHPGVVEESVVPEPSHDEPAERSGARRRADRSNDEGVVPTT